VSTDKTVPLPTDGGPDPTTVAATLQAELFARSEMIATAESLTGGELGTLLSAAPGASDTYLGGVVAYATSVKATVLDVSQSTIERHGVVSAECAEEMAAGVRSLLQADYGLSTTGVAGPAEQEGKPVGLVYVGVAGPDGVASIRLDLDGERTEIRARSCLEAMSAAIAAVSGRPTEQHLDGNRVQERQADTRRDEQSRADG
jgi:nicotinamide-nucleotide amidase